MALSESLPADILLVMLSHLDTKDVLNFRKTCKVFYELSESRTVWDSLLRRCIIERDIPLPGLAGCSLTSLDAQDLEGLHRRALELHRNWHVPSPVIRRSIQLVRSGGSGRILRMGVLLGRNGGRWLVSLSVKYGRHGGGVSQSTYTVRCWDLCQAPQPVCVAEREFDRFRGMAINKRTTTATTTAESDCIAVLTPRGIEILSLVGNATNPRDGFMTTKTVSVPMSTLHYFQDRRVITTDSNGRLYLLNIDRPQVKVEFQHSTDPTRDFILTNTFILVLKRKTLEFYPVPLSNVLPTHVIIPPIFAYQWPWTVDYGVMTLRGRRRACGVGIGNNDHDSSSLSMNDPITMFIRFSGGFMLPWSNNIIHQYEIRPNAYFVSSQLPSELNVPYEYPPLLRGTVAAPVRMGTPTDLVLGAYGTAVWIDSHAEMYYHGTGGQRVAGTYARVVELRGADEEGDEEGDLLVEGGPFDNSETREASFVFAHQREESWNGLTVDEEEGVIFLGRDSGVIDMLKYGV